MEDFAEYDADGSCDAVAGAGTHSGFMPKRIPAPMTPNTHDTVNPLRVRSIKYHITGLTSASVKDTCSVDCQDSFLYVVID